MKESIACIVVDDEPLASKVIEEYVMQVPQLQLVGTCDSAMQAFQLLHNEHIDLMFLDIEMPEMSGLSFLKSISNPPDVILTTAYREYALESYEVDVSDYLLKPISFQRFFKSITKYIEKRNGKNMIAPIVETDVSKGSLFVYADKKNIRVYYNDILYVESIKDYVRLHCKDGNIISKDTISRYEEILPANFIRIHRSFIINKSKITAYTNHDVELGKKEIPIGVSYKKEVLADLQK